MNQSAFTEFIQWSGLDSLRFYEWWPFALILLLIVARIVYVVFIKKEQLGIFDSKKAKWPEESGSLKYNKGIKGRHNHLGYRHQR